MSEHEGYAWTIADVATYLGVSRKAIYTSREEWGIPYVRVGSAIRFRPSEVESWANERRSVA